MILGFANLLFFNMALQWVSFASVFANFLFIILLLGIAACYFLQTPPKDDESYEYISKDTLEYYYRKFVNAKICLIERIQKIERLENPISIAKDFGILYVASVITGNMCTCMLMWISVNLLFLIPLAYKTQQQKLDDLSKTVKSLICSNFEKIESKIPRYVEKAKKE